MNKILEDLKQLKAQHGHTILIGISGIHQSGKTEQAIELKKQLESDYKVGILHLKENEQVKRLALKDKNPSKYYYENIMDFARIKFQIGQMIQKENYDFFIIEGPLLFKNTNPIHLDYTIWIDCSFTTSINRTDEKNKEYAKDLGMGTQRIHYSIDQPKSKVNTIINNDDLKPSVLVDSINNPQSLQTMKWLNEPAVWKIDSNILYVETQAITDFWQRTHYGFRNDNGHFYYVETSNDFEMTTKVTFSPVHQFDQCGLMVRIDEDHWIKTSIEFELDQPAKLGAVVTNLGYSDWSTQEINKDVREIELKIIREQSDYIIQYRIGNESFKQLRIAHMHHTSSQVMCGVYACSPIDSGYKVHFKEITIKEIIF